MAPCRGDAATVLTFLTFLTSFFIESLRHAEYPEKKIPVLLMFLCHFMHELTALISRA